MPEITNEMIGVEVMGWKAEKGASGRLAYWITAHGTTAAHIGPDLKNGEFILGRSYFTPLSDIVSAFRVVDRMIELGYMFEVGTISRKEKWYAEFQKRTDEYPCGSHAKTKEQAICCAAIGAVRADKGG